MNQPASSSDIVPAASWYRRRSWACDRVGEGAASRWPVVAAPHRHDAGGAGDDERWMSRPPTSTAP